MKIKQISKIVIRNFSICVFIISFKSYALGQNLIILDSLYHNVTGDTVIVNCNTSETEYYLGLSIQNNSLTQISVKVKKYIINDVSGTSNLFAWAGLMFPPTIFTSPNAAQIQPNSIDSSFSSHLYNSFNGTVSIMYVFFNDSDINDSVSVIVNYTASLLSIKNNITIPVSIYPNPSNGLYTIENNDYSNLEIYSINGQLIEIMNLNREKIWIDLKYLKKGIYNIKFSNSQGYEMKKLIIN